MPQTKLLVRAGTIKIGLVDPPTVEYAAQVIGFRMDANAQMVDTPDTWGQDGTQTWVSQRPTLTVRYLQDWNTGGLAMFLYTNMGKYGWIIAQPTNTALPTFKYNVQFCGPNHLGDAGALLEDTVTFSVISAVPTPST
jgi:hypothetical protein